MIAGAVLGIVTSYLFTHPYQGWNIEVEAGGGYCGICLCHRW